MAYKPYQDPRISAERSDLLSETEKAIDEWLYNERGAPAHFVFLEKAPKGYSDWFCTELVDKYKNAGWKYVTIFLGQNRPATPGGLPRMHFIGDYSMFLYVSNNNPISLWKGEHYVSGDAVQRSKTSRFIRWLVS